MRKSTITHVAIGVFASLMCLTILTSEAVAQSTITGAVKDETGAVLPGVTIEANSPSLIERTRTVITDESGNYRIIDLRPGSYSITFSLPGFKTYKREEVELVSNFTATINAVMTVGAVDQTITVATETPVVDLETNIKAQVLPRDTLDSIPTAHTIQSVGQLVLGIQLNSPDVGGSQAMQQTYFTVHGAGVAQTSVLMDGMILNGLQGDGAVQSYMNDAGNEQMVYQTGGGNAETPTGGLKLNMAPKEGGNSLHGSVFAGFESSSLQSNNLSPFLASHGVKAVDRIGTYRDIDWTLGGPIKKDKLWFFTSSRFFTVNRPVANSFWIPQGRTYADCLNAVVACKQAINEQTINSVLLRLTWQVSARNKLSAYMDRLFKTRDHDVGPGDDPATAGFRWNSPIYETSTIKWTSTLSSRLLIEGGYSSNIERYNNLYEPGVRKPYGSPEWYAGALKNDTILNTRTNARTFEYGSYPDRHNAQAAVSYILGSHNIKFGLQDSWGSYNQTAWANADLYQNYQSGLPFTVTLLATPARWKDRLNANLGIYGQDAWTIKRRLTITYGLRFEYVSEQVSGQPAQQGRFANIPAFGDIHMPIWRTYSPRTAVVFDLFGNGKTAIRFGFNRFEAAATTTIAGLYNPANMATVQATAAWTDGTFDPVLNQIVGKDDIAQGTPGCVYLSPGCEINFQNVPKNFGTVSLSNPDPNLERPYSQAYNVGVTHELLRGVAVTAEFFRSYAKNILERNNTLRPGTMTGPSSVSNANYRAVPVFSPIDGHAITMYDPISTAVQQAVANVDTNDPKLKNVYTGFEFNFNAKLPHGGRIFGGSSTDRSVANTCGAAATNPNFLIYCDQSQYGIPWRTQFKLVGTYPLPWWGIQFSGSLQALPGYVLYHNALPTLQQGSVVSPNASLNFPNSAGTVFQISPTTRYTVCPGESAAAGCHVGDLVITDMKQAQLNVPLIPTGTELTPRVNQVDFSVSKRFTFERIRLEPKIDIFNAFNSSDYYTVRSMVYSTTANATYKLPGSILQGRIVRLGAVFNW
jgi:Carboxypeptidase regulatory-like domain/TonB dependent receptor-like, beta-barrel